MRAGTKQLLEHFTIYNKVLILLGARQVGKTHVLKYIQKLLEEEKSKTFYYDLEYPDLLGILNKGTSEFISNLGSKGYLENENVFVFIIRPYCLPNILNKPVAYRSFNYI